MTSMSSARSSNFVTFDKAAASRRLVAVPADDTAHVNHPSGPDPLVIGKRVRHRRRTCGLTLGALGERVGLSASAVSLIETGKREAKVSTLAALAEALDCRLSDLLTEDAPSRRAASELNGLPPLLSWAVPW